jgi:hypothetical protein
LLKDPSPPYGAAAGEVPGLAAATPTRILRVGRGIILLVAQFAKLPVPGAPRQPVGEPGG